MGKAQKGKAGCGCLLFVLVFCMIAAGALVHPLSLKIIAGRLRHEDKIVRSDAIFVPRFAEDKDGELYAEAFREYWAGNAKVIWVENDRVFGFTIKDMVARMAKERGIKDANAVRGIDLEGDDAAKARTARQAFAKQGVKKLIVIAPDYASKRFQMLYATESGDPIVLIKPARVSYFKLDKWWRDDLSRTLMEKELLRTAVLWGRSMTGSKEDSTKAPQPAAR